MFLECKVNGLIFEELFVFYKRCLSFDRIFEVFRLHDHHNEYLNKQINIFSYRMNKIHKNK